MEISDYLDNSPKTFNKYKMFLKEIWSIVKIYRKHSRDNIGYSGALVDEAIKEALENISRIIEPSTKLLKLVQNNEFYELTHTHLNSHGKPFDEEFVRRAEIALKVAVAHKEFLQYYLDHYTRATEGLPKGASAVFDKTSSEKGDSALLDKTVPPSANATKHGISSRIVSESQPASSSKSSSSSSSSSSKSSSSSSSSSKSSSN